MQLGGCRTFEDFQLRSCRLAAAMGDTFRHRETLAVRWGDMDAMGHVNNAAFFTYCESARMSYFAAIEIDRWSRESALTAKPRLPRSDLDAGASVDHL